MSWRPTWKTQLIATVLCHRRGAFIDVGANVGQTLLDFLQAPVRSTYLGFEPNPTCFQHLRELLALNHLDSCRVYPAALFDRTGVETLHLFGGDTDPGASILSTLRPDRHIHTLPVCAYRFDDLRDIVPEPEIALVKIDVEGAELEVLHGMQNTLREKRPWILCEVLHRDERSDPSGFERRCDLLIQMVHDLGYDAHQIIQEESGSAVRGLDLKAEFPKKDWDDRSALECDYLFVPKSEAAKLFAVLADLAI